MTAEKKRVGIMGGTFDPIHMGHLVIAEAARETLGLSQVIFIPAAQPPHKTGRKVAAAEHRLRLTQLAVEGNPHFCALDLEMRREGPSYSYDTLRALVEEHGESTDFYFIVGGDELDTIFTWHRVSELFSLCHFAAAKRKGSPIRLDDVRERLGEEVLARIHPVNTPELEISSTDIRRRLREGRSIRYLVPEKVEACIYKEGLYS
ncbi:nicotinate-nucleotide adenylyltransferase [uncultured Selenomonas sp.]|uniref:nicotinate-nucleotide adenylyltransferase n=1 Tax=uncultured Selenomonas sp. TaxID=159275 RepID=UPI0028DB0FEB|nr:nicotinate-nucleotide adenylyltransferase [uncultured Selenomonas sp.]